MSAPSEYLSTRKTLLLGRPESLAVEALKPQIFCDWLEGFKSPDQPWRWLVTLTMRRFDPRFHKPWDPREIELATIRFVRRLNDMWWGHGSRRRGETFGWVCVAHTGPCGNHPHVHGMLAAPKNIPIEDIRATVKRCAGRIDWIQKIHHVTPFTGSGIFKYFFHEPNAEIFYEASRRAVP